MRYLANTDDFKKMLEEKGQVYSERIKNANSYDELFDVFNADYQDVINDINITGMKFWGSVYKEGFEYNIAGRLSRILNHLLPDEMPFRFAAITGNAYKSFDKRITAKIIEKTSEENIVGFLNLDIRECEVPKRAVNSRGIGYEVIGFRITEKKNLSENLIDDCIMNTLINNLIDISHGIGTANRKKERTLVEYNLDRIEKITVEIRVHQ